MTMICVQSVYRQCKEINLKTEWWQSISKMENTKLHIDNKLNNFFKITGILNNVFRPQKKTLIKTRIKLYNTLALPVLLYGSEK